MTPGYAVVFPNREKASSKLMKAVVALVLLVSVGLLLIVTINSSPTDTSRIKATIVFISLLEAFSRFGYTTA